MGTQLNNFDVFEDRVQSLLTRWRAFMEKHPTVTPQEAIKACMSEINDGFTRMLMGE